MKLSCKTSWPTDTEKMLCVQVKKSERKSTNARIVFSYECVLGHACSHLGWRYLLSLQFICLKWKQKHVCCQLRLLWTPMQLMLMSGDAFAVSLGPVLGSGENSYQIVITNWHAHIIQHQEVTSPKGRHPNVLSQVRLDWTGGASEIMSKL